MAEKIPLEQRLEATLDALTNYQPIWSGYKLRRERTLVTTRYGTVSGDPHLELSYQATNRHMDKLLDNYHGLLNETVEPVEVRKVEVPPQGYQLVDGRGSQ